MIRTEVASSLPQPGQWNGQAGLRALQGGFLPDAVLGAARCQVNRERLDIAGTVEVLSDLDRVPTIDKQCLREQYPLGLLAVSRDRVATYHESSPELSRRGRG